MESKPIWLTKPHSITVTTLTDLKTSADKTKYYLARSIQAIAGAGLELMGAYDKCPHGLWEKYCWDMVGISPRTALRYRKVTELLLDYVPEDEIANVQAEPRALYQLINGQLPDEARGKAIEFMLTGQFLTGAIVTGMVKEVERKMEQAELLQHVQSPDVAQLILEYDIDPDVIPGLTRMSSEDVQTLSLTGSIEDLDGESLSLEDATGRDMQYYEERGRLENYLATKQPPTCVPCQKTMALLTVGEKEQLDNQYYLVDQYECPECLHVISMNHRRMNK